MEKQMSDLLMKVAGELQDLADKIQALCTDGENAPEEAPPISLEKVRGVLADKSRSGHTAQVRALIQKYGADRLSEIDPKDYGAIIKEAEVL